MPTDTTETFRRRRLTELNPGRDREVLERLFGKIWNPKELAVEFEVIAFLAPYVVVRQKAGGKQGSLEFQAHPRLYFNWQEDDEQS